jgi:glycosyltransferase involved in cell wall biosynthesis
VDIFPTLIHFALGSETKDFLPYPLSGRNLDSAAAYGSRCVYSETWQNDSQNHATPLVFISSLLEQRGIRGESKKYIINGTPEVFGDENQIEKMSDEAFLQYLYRGLLCRFENYEEYIRELRYLKNKRNTKNNLLKTVRESIPYLSRPSLIMYDLEKDPFEERHVAAEDGSDEMRSYAQEIYRISSDSSPTEEIFDQSAVFKGIAANVARLEEKHILETIEDKHVFSLLIDDFVKTRKNVEYDKSKIEELIMGSDEFSRFLLDRLSNPRQPEVRATEHADAARELHMMKNSISWRIVQSATSFFDEKLFPAGTKRRNMLARFVYDPFARKRNEGSLDEQLIRKLKNAAEGKRILVITYEVPQFDLYSGAHRFFNLIHILRELDFSVTVLSDSPVVRMNYAAPLENLGVDILYGERHLHPLKDVGTFFDYVLLHTPSTAGYIDPVRRFFQKAVVIFDTSDLHYLRFEREGYLTGNAESLRKASEYRRIELSLAKKSDVVFTVSEAEREVLRRDAGDVRVQVVPNIHRLEPTAAPFEKRRDVMFVGAFSHGPNGDAVFYFLKEIFPPLVERMDINCYIIGKNPPPELLSLQTPNVIATGYIPDIMPYFEKCRLMVAPLRYGAGVKGKLTQSMSVGLPFVTTSVGAEGMDLVDGRHCFIADDPGVFGDRISRLYTDRQLWETFRENSLRLASERFSYETIKHRLRDFFSEGR